MNKLNEIRSEILVQIKRLIDLKKDTIDSINERENNPKSYNEDELNSLNTTLEIINKNIEHYTKLYLKDIEGDKQ